MNQSYFPLSSWSLVFGSSYLFSSRKLRPSSSISSTIIFMILHFKRVYMMATQEKEGHYSSQYLEAKQNQPRPISDDGTDLIHVRNAMAFPPASPSSHDPAVAVWRIWLIASISSCISFLQSSNYCKAAIVLCSCSPPTRSTYPKLSQSSWNVLSYRQ